MQVSGQSLQDPVPWGGQGTLGHALLEPTLIYVKRLLALIDAVQVKVSIDTMCSNHRANVTFESQSQTAYAATAKALQA